MVTVWEGSALKHLARIGADGVHLEPGKLDYHGRHPDDGRVDRRPDGARPDRRSPAAGQRPAAEPAGSPANGAGAPEAPAGETGERTVCGFCGAEFVEDRSQATCQACPLSRACGLVRCPECGYENPKQPAWIAKLKEWMG